MLHFLCIFELYIFPNISLKSSHWRCSIKKAVYKNFAIFTGKQLCWSQQTLLKKDSNAGVFL